jgi:hypothetical protein
MAHGRVPQPTPPQIPVLTGMPVSGMAYLDRPSEAGYFIFPDLSVRHEGKYRLSFNLYEETKEAKDGDAETSKDQKPKVPSGPASPDSSFDWRLEVKSNVFTVFSAKKFPGLAESTVLSRTVAEQGCRVRIRRDVRMRRRDGKNGNDYDDAEQDEYARGRPPVASDDSYRHRSLTVSPDGRPPYPEERRMSTDYQQYTPSPVTPHASGPQSYLSFGGSQYQASQPHFAQPQPPAPPQYQSGPSPYHHPGPQYRQQAPPPPHNNYGYDRQFPHSAHPSYPPREQREYEPEYRRASVAAYPASGPHSGPYPNVDPNYNRTSGVPFPYPPRPRSPSLPGGVNLAPLKMPPIEPKYEGHTSPPGPLTSVSRIAPPILSPTYERGPERQGSYSQYSAPLPAPAEPARNGKRPFDSVFTPSTNQPLYNGMRPSSSHHKQGAADDDDESMSLEQLKMQYKRADGSSYSRELPVLE